MRTLSMWVLGFFAAAISPSVAQVVPDNSLGAESSVVVPTAPQVDAVAGGAQRGTTLFHSFEQFSIPESAAVIFQNPEMVNAIFSRVTGSEVSQLLGTLAVDGAATLFLLNPNGIVFGPDSVLNVPGSFVGSTASEVLFESGYRFDTAGEAVPPVLVNTVPVGLGLGSEPGQIRINGSGHQYVFAPPLSPSSPSIGSISGLNQFPASSTILVGGDIVLNGGVLSGIAGDVRLVATDHSMVSLTSSGNSFTVSVSNPTRDITLQNFAAIETVGGGNINISAENLNILSGSLITSNSFSDIDGGDVTLVIDTLFAAQGETAFQIPEDLRPRGIFVQSFASGASGEINIFADRFEIRDFTQVRTASFGDGPGGDVFISSESVLVDGTQILDGTFTTSAIGADSAGNGRGGNIVLEGNELSLENGGFVISSLVGPGVGGDVFVDSESVSLTGSVLLVSDSFSGSFLGSVATVQSRGSSGRVSVVADHVAIRDGSAIASSSSGLASAGSVTVEADIVDVSGTTTGDASTRSRIESNANRVSTELGNFVGVPQDLVGASGEVTIVSDSLSLANGALISASTEGTGSAGSVSIDSGRINLEDSEVSASTRTRTGGNVSLVSDSILLQTSIIGAESLESGDGGNISIQTGTLILDDSTIQANAFDGRGGNISIAADALIQNPGSVIEASSQLGIEGVVEIESPDTEFLFDLVAPQPELLVERELVIDENCIVGRDRESGELIVTVSSTDITPPDRVPPELLEEIEPDEIIRMPDGRILALSYCSNVR